MNISFDLLRVFKVVAFHCSISKAAKELCVTQSSVTKSIKKLEFMLNTVLFVREKRGVSLTDKGKDLYRYILDSINVLDGTFLHVQKINELDVGKIRIGAGDSVTKSILKKSIVDFKRLHPGIVIELHNSSSSQLYNDLRYGRLDVIFVNSTVIINDSKYKCFKLKDIDDCFFTSPVLYEKMKNVTNIKNILSSSLIVQNEMCDTRNFLNSICLKNNIQLKPTIEVERHGLIVEFVKEGLGIDFATKQYIQSYLDSGELMELNVDFDIQRRYINCVYRNVKNVKVNSFIDILKKNIY